MVNGQKLWTSFAHHANKCILLARTDPDAPKHKGITLFLLDMDTPGVTVRPLRQITDRHEFNEVFLEDVRIPAGMHLGAVNEGWHAAVGVLGFERATARLYRQSRFQAEFDALLKRLAARPEKAADSWFRQQVGALATDLRVLRLLNLKTVSRIVNGKGIGSRQASSSCSGAKRTRGSWISPPRCWATPSPTAIPRPSSFRFLYLQSRAETIYAGTSEIQRNIIAERMLGLPR